MPPLLPRLIRASDGASIRVLLREHDGPTEPVVLLGAPGTPPAFWSHQLEHLARRRRVLVFEHPEVVAPTSRASSAERSRQDVLEALDELAIERAALVSWSLGAQIALDVAGHAPGRCGHVVCINPLLSPRFARSMGLLGDDPVGPLMGRLAVRATPLLARARRRLGFVDAGAWLRRAGLASVTIEAEALEAAIEELGRVDDEGIGRVLRGLEAQPKGPTPEQLTPPTLLVVGDADVVSSGLVARRLSRRLPLGELLSIRGGTHLAPLEYPEYVSLAIERFLDR